MTDELREEIFTLGHALLAAAFEVENDEYTLAHQVASEVGGWRAFEAMLNVAAELLDELAVFEGCSPEELLRQRSPREAARHV